MRNLGTICLETTRLVLRRFTLDDIDDVYNNYASNPNVTKYLTWDAHENKDVTKSILTSWVNSYYNDYFYQWAIVCKRTNEVIGAISIVDIDMDNELFEVGYCIGESYWGNEFTKEALNAVIEYLFEKVNIKGIIGCHELDNINSGKVLEKCGLKYTHIEEKYNTKVKFYRLDNIL